MSTRNLLFKPTLAPILRDRTSCPPISSIVEDIKTMMIAWSFLFGFNIAINVLATATAG